MWIAQERGDGHAGFWFENLKEWNRLEDKGVEGKTLKQLIKKQDGGWDWIALAQNGDRWRALENTVIKRRVTYNARNFLIT